MQKVIISIIIPHKNIPNLLQRCLDSIPVDDDIQIIIVDDNSDPSVVDFDRFPGNGCPNTVVCFTKESKGAGYARNIGLDHAKGKWLLFADADDFFTEKAFNSIFAHIESLHEIVYFRVTGCYSDTYYHENRESSINSLVNDYLNGKKDCENQIRYLHINPIGKMILKELVDRENIRFEEIIASNDRMFSILTGYYASSIGVCNQEIYCVTIRRGSLCFSKSREIMTSRFLATLRCNQFLREHQKHRYQSHILNYLFYSLEYGIKTFFIFVRLAFSHNSNLFLGITKSVPSFIAMKVKRKKYSKYFVEKK